VEKKFKKGIDKGQEKVKEGAESMKKGIEDIQYKAQKGGEAVKEGIEKGGEKY